MSAGIDDLGGGDSGRLYRAGSPLRQKSVNFPLASRATGYFLAPTVADTRVAPRPRPIFLAKAERCSA